MVSIQLLAPHLVIAETRLMANWHCNQVLVRFYVEDEMPNWQPNRNPVRWDWGAASEAVAALERAAARIEETLHERLRLAAEAQQEWRGRYRDQFDGDLERIKTRARQLISEYRAKAWEIRSASERALQEKHRREAEIARWEREKAEEDRRRQN